MVYWESNCDMNALIFARILFFRSKGILMRVIENTPCEAAGIVSGEDFLLGTPRFYYKEYDEFQKEFRRILKLGNTSKKNVKIPLVFFNIKRKDVRTVLLEFLAGADENELIGLEFSLGLLHNLIHIVNYKNIKLSGI